MFHRRGRRPGRSNQVRPSRRAQKKTIPYAVQLSQADPANKPDTNTDVPEPVGIAISLTPRLWYSFLNPNGFAGNSSKIDSFEELSMPLTGFTAGIRPNGWESDILFTALYGTGSGKISSANGSATSTNGEYDATRLDIEVLQRFAIPGTAISWFYGGRYIHGENDAEHHSASGITFRASGTRFLEEATNIYLVEGGIGFFTPITEDGQHGLFGSGGIGLGYGSHKVGNRTTELDPDESGVVVSWDINVGYQYTISDSVAAHARYRAFVIPVAGDTTTNFFVVHGPEVGATIRF